MEQISLQETDGFLSDKYSIKGFSTYSYSSCNSIITFFGFFYF